MIKIACFQTDATPLFGAPLCNGGVKPARIIVAPLSARGLVILGAGSPIVLCAVDWVGIGGSGHDFWRKVLAEAAGTSVDRVTVHTIHPHDAPGHNFSSADLADFKDILGQIQDTTFAENTARNTAEKMKAALAAAKPVTHYSYGKAKVSKVASNRRLLGSDGKVAHVRYSCCRDKAVRDLPEGLIDPWLQNLVFWNGEEALVSLTYYATHPQSFYGDGAVSPDFVGLARSVREATLPETFHLHFNGCGGNVAAGKYNDRSPRNRLILAERLLKGMETAWARAKKYPLKETDIQWRVKPMALPLRDTVLAHSEEEYLKLINSGEEDGKRRMAARDLSLLRRAKAGPLTDVSCLKVGRLKILHLPGEMFVEFQLAAREMGAPRPVLVAAYGNYEHGYIGTKISYGQGGYETSERASRVAPESEEVVMATMRELLAS